MSVVVLLSGRGSNLKALIEAGIPVCAAISNVPGAAGLAHAAAAGIPTHTIAHRGFSSRDAFEAALADAIDRHAPRLVALAGFLRILTPAFVARYDGRLMNIHPSLLPAFPGLDTHRRALEAGVKVHGCTVHFVTADLDRGPIVVQAAVAVRAEDTEATLAARVLREEHRIYPLAVRWFLEDRLEREGAIVRVRGGDAQAYFGTSV
jgi:phosphoribosylglycinamide formyltransferase-1